MSSTIVITAAGLVTSSNQLEVPAGSMSEASNCIIKRQGVVESRRGLKLYGDAFPGAADRAKQLMSYKGILLRHYYDNTSSTNKLQFDSDGEGTFSTFSGTYNEAQTGLRIKSLESNGNLYFTTDAGIKKISAELAADLSTAANYITPAGGIKATDVTTKINLEAGNVTGVLPQDSTVAYRIVWGSNDANDNLILGTPSQRSEIYNPLLNMLLLDYSDLLQSLDLIAPSSLINLGTYVNTFKLLSSASASTLYTGLQNLCTQIDNDILYADNVAVAPIQIYSAAIATSVCTVTFAYKFTVTAANATINDTYTNNGFTYTVLATIAGATTLYCTGTGVPAASGTLTKTAGAGDATITFSAFAGQLPSNYWVVGDKLRLAGFAPGTPVDSLNGSKTITTITASTITFSTTSSGVVTLTTPTINSYNYENLSPGYALPATPPTDDDLVNLQGTIDSIFTRLQAEPNATITTAYSTAYIATLAITTTANVLVTFSVPADVTLNNFYQIYRSATLEATGSTSISSLTPGDEMKLVYEAYITSTELAAKTITIEDTTPDSFAGAYLYSNQVSGEGSLQTNDIPPFALDIAKFKNVTFYGNTRTRQRLSFSLLGVTNMVAAYSPSAPPKVTITDGVTTNTYSFILGIKQITTVLCIADVANSLNGDYFNINSAEDGALYYVWYKTSGGAVSDPAPVGRTGIRVNVVTNSTAATVGQLTRDALAGKLFDFTTSLATATVTVTNVNVGYTTAPSAQTSGFTVTVTTTGKGEDATLKQVLLSSETSPSIAVDATARSFIRVVNKNATEDVYLYYLSSNTGVPGQFFGESRSINSNVFYLLANNTTTGQSFTPDISPVLSITTISIAAQAVITTSGAHGLTNGMSVVITNTNSTPVVDGLRAITYISPTTFSVPVTTTVGGNQGAAKVSTAAVFSANDTLPNRILYSKLNQPDAVPIVNTIDVGAKDKEILRIFALRDSLFVYKQDGLFRISGEVAPFSLALFDASTILIAPDSLSLSNNLVYGWTTQGVCTTSESGVQTITRPIDVDILNLASNNYPNFGTITWGVGYESDNSYTVFTNTSPSDTEAEIGYRFGNLTNTWTTIDKTATCGIINSTDDKLYIGAGDTNYIEQERKTFSRLDYADRELDATISSGTVNGAVITLSSISLFDVGDNFVQQQLLSIYTYNALLLKLDLDSNLQNNYYSLLIAVAGDDMSAKLITLAAKLDADPGTTSSYATIVQSITAAITAISIANPTVITSAGHGLVTGRVVTLTGTNSSPTINGTYTITYINANTFSVPVEVNISAGTAGTFITVNSSFQDIVACYNGVIAALNADPGVSFKNYLPSSGTTELEATILSINTLSKQLTLNYALDFMVGPAIIFKAIDCEFTYSPNTMGDPLSLKHFSESTVMFENRAFTNAIFSVASDLHPSFVPTSFNGDGNGIFGVNQFGAGFFGGGSNGAPFRTLIPRDCQRGRYLLIRFNHSVAREKITIFGITLTGASTSTRAYR